MNNLRNLLAERREFFQTGAVVIAALLFLAFFREADLSNVSATVQSTVVSLVFFLVVPIIYCKMILKEPLSSLGWREGDMLPGFFWGVLSVTAGLSFILALSLLWDVRFASALPLTVLKNFWWFVGYELLLTGFLTLIFEVFFRGLVMLRWLAPSIGIFSVVVQTLFFLGLLLADGSFEPADRLLTISAFLSGCVAYFSGSIRFSWGASWLFLVLADIVFLALRTPL